jgi:hypothetical protein
MARFLFVALALSAFAPINAEVLHGRPTPPLHAGQAAQQAAWHAMGGAPCAWFRPIENSDHSLNVDETIRMLRDFGFGCAVSPIEGGPPNDSPTFQKLLRAWQAADIDLWAVLVPPTEGGNSHPYDTDYVKWFQALATLSLKYSHLRGANIDDLLVDYNPKTFRHEYLCQIYQAKQKINPHFLFVPTVYDLDAGEAARLAGCVDGVWLWWMNLERGLGLASFFLENARVVVVGRRFPVYGGVYADGTSWHKEGEPTVRALMSSIEAACRYSDGVVVYELSLNPADPLLQIAESYAPRRSAMLADKCGTPWQVTKKKRPRLSF